MVLQFENSWRSSRRNGLGFSGRSYLRMIKEDLKFHCYRIVRKHEMKDGDRAARMEFCRAYVNMTDEERLNICFSDEAAFQMGGSVNSQNVRRYDLPKYRGGDGRPEEFTFPNVSYPKKCQVFAGLHSSGKYYGISLGLQFRQPTIGH